MRNCLTLFVAAMMLLLIGCEKDPVQQKNLSLSSDELEFDAAGGSLDLEVRSAGSWTLSGECMWCVPSVRTGEDRDVVAFSAVENIEETDRFAEFTFRSDTHEAVLHVSQRFATLSLSASVLTIGESGGSAKLQIDCNGQWKLTGEAVWCVPSMLAGEGAAEIEFMALENSGTESRTVEYVVTCGPRTASVTVVQPASNAPTVIYYTSIDGTVIEPMMFHSDAQVVSNTYELGEGGKIVLDRRIDHIPYYMFRKNEMLLSIVIPEGITVIEENAFSGCSNLSSVSLPQTLLRIEGASPSYQHNGAFASCTSLTSLDLPASVEYIGSYVFASAGLDRINIPSDSHLQKIDEAAFANTKLSEIFLPETLETLGSGIFSGCVNLKSVEIPRGVKISDGWGYGAVTRSPFGLFENCTGLESVTLPDDLDILADNIFYGCTSLKTIDLPTSLQQIGSNAFYGCTSLESVTIPANVTIIRDGEQPYYDCGTFMDCTGLREVVIPSDSRLEEIGKFAFTNCSGLVSIDLPSGLKTIDLSAFQNCSSLTELNIPDAIEQIGENVFCGCDNLERFTGKLVTSDGRGVVLYGRLLAFAPAGVTRYEFPEIVDGVWRIENGVFRECDKLETIRIPDGVTEIGVSAFQDCTALTSLNIPQGMKSISTYMCMGCSALESIILPETVTNIGYAAFKDCRSLKNIDLPGVEVMESEAFAQCKGLTSVTLPDCLTSMTNAFYECPGLYEVYCRPVVPPYVGNSFTGTRGDLRIYVPSGSVDSYKQDSGWSQYADRIVGYDF